MNNPPSNPAPKEQGFFAKAFSNLISKPDSVVTPGAIRPADAYKYEQLIGNGVQRQPLTPEQQQIAKEVPIEILFNILTTLSTPTREGAIDHGELCTLSTGAEFEACFEQKGAGVAHATLIYNTGKPIDLNMYLVNFNRFIVCSNGEYIFTSTLTFLTRYLSGIPLNSVVSISYVDNTGEEYLLFNRV